MDRAAFWLYRLVAGAVCVLPLKLVFRLGWLLGTLAYYFAVPYRRLVLRNLQIAFGKEKSRAELRTLARKHFATLGANLFASIKLPRLSRAEIESVVRVEGLQYMDRGADEHGGFVNVISHLGNWEMFAQISPIFFKCKVGTIYQALGNPHIDAEIQRERARLGLALFERKEGFVAATKFIRAGGAVGVLVDQHAGDAGLWCPFFGRLASTSTLAATLALRTGAAPSASGRVHRRRRSLAMCDRCADRFARSTRGSRSPADQRGPRRTNPCAAGGLVLGSQPLETAATEIPPRHLQTWSDDSCQLRARSGVATVPNSHPLAQLARRRRHERSRGAGNQTRPSGCARHDPDAGETRGLVERCRRGG